MNDWEQLKAYAEKGDQRAFAALVSQYVGLVYGAASRKLGNTAAAEEVVQTVFILLAKKAGKLKPSGSLGAWLYSTACRQAIDLYRKESARRRREEKHAMDKETILTEESSLWTDIVPILDEAMASLDSKDRTAVLMRYFEERPLKEVSQVLEVSEDAARKRVARALDRLRHWFQRRGVECSTSALGVALGAYAAKTFPQHLAESAAQAALSHAGTQISAAATLTTMTSIKLPMIAGLLAGTALPLTFAYRQNHEEHPPEPEAPPALALDVSLPSAEMSGLIAEWNQLRTQYGPNGGSMAAFYEAVQKVSDDFKRRVFRTALVAHWATDDPLEAMAFFEQKKDNSRMGDVLRVWLERDASAALSAMKTHGDDWSVPIGNLLSDLADSHPDALADVAPLVKVRHIYDRHVQKAFAKVAKTDLTKFREIAESMQGEARKEALAGVAEAWAEQDGQAALKWAESLTESEDRSRALRFLLAGWAKADPVAALDHLDLAPPGGLQPMDGFVQSMGGLETAELVLDAAIEKDFEGTLAWLTDNPGKIPDNQIWSKVGRAFEKRFYENMPETLASIRDHHASEHFYRALDYVLSNKGRAYIDDVWDWASQEPPSTFRMRLKRQALIGIATEDTPRALQLAQDLVAQGEVDAVHFGVLGHRVVDDWSDYQEHESFFAHGPREIQDQLVTKVLARTPELEVGREAWFSMLDRLPAKNRQDVLEQKVQAQAVMDPQEAVSWAVSLPEPDQPDVHHALVEQWAGADSYEASKWIATLDSGLNRDHAALALVEQVARAEPDSAWQWAQTIEAPKVRESALKKALHAMGKAAGDTVALSSLAAEEKAQLNRWLDSKQSINPNR